MTFACCLYTSCEKTHAESDIDKSSKPTNENRLFPNTGKKDAGVATNNHYQIKGPRDNPEPFPHSRIEWSNREIRIHISMRRTDANDQLEERFLATLELQKNKLFQCASKETTLIYGNFYWNIKFTTNTEGQLEEGNNFISEPGSNSEVQTVAQMRILKCIRITLKSAIRNLRTDSQAQIPFSIHMNWRNPDKYVVVGDLSRIHTKDKRVAVGIGNDRVCAVDPKGTIMCWSHLGDKNLPQSPGPFKDLSFHFENACGIQKDDFVKCWTFENTIGTAYSPRGKFKNISVGYKTACGVTKNGMLKCWDFQTGSKKITPQGTYLQVSIGLSYACALTISGKPECWSLNNLNTWPIEWKAKAYRQVSVGGGFVCAISEGDRIECHIYEKDKTGNMYGQIGSPDGSFKKVSAGSRHGCAIETDNRVKCWGDNRAGQTNAPADYFDSVVAGSSMSCGIKTDGTLVCWGNKRLPADSWN